MADCAGSAGLRGRLPARCAVAWSKDRRLREEMHLSSVLLWATLGGGSLLMFPSSAVKGRGNLSRRDCLRHGYRL
jgi:hypothetical protein